MSKRSSNQYPPITKFTYEVGVGNDGESETIGIRPAIGFEILRASGLDSLNIDWAVDDLVGEVSDATLLVRRSNELGVSTQLAAIRLATGLCRVTGKSTVFSPEVIDVGRGVAPFRRA